MSFVFYFLVGSVSFLPNFSPPPRLSLLALPGSLETFSGLSQVP